MQVLMKSKRIPAFINFERNWLQPNTFQNINNVVIHINKGT